MKKKTWKILDVAVTVNGSVYLLLRRWGTRYEVRVVDGFEYGSAVFVIRNRFRKISGKKQVEITKEDVLKRLLEFGVWYCSDFRCVYIGGMDFFEEDVYRASKFVCRGSKRVFDTVLSMAKVPPRFDNGELESDSLGTDKRG